MLRTEWHATINCNSDELFLISRELHDRHVMAIKLNLNSKLEYIRINNFHHYYFKRQLKGSRNTKSRRRQELHALVNILLVFFQLIKGMPLVSSFVWPDVWSIVMNQHWCWLQANATKNAKSKKSVKCL